MTMDVQHMATMMDRFRTYVLVELGLSPMTLVAYKKDIKDFLKFVAVDSSVAISAEEINRYTDQLKSMGLKNSTISRKLMAIRCYCNHLVSEGSLNAGVPQIINKLKRTKEPPRAILPESINRILEIMGNDSSKLRNHHVLRNVSIVLMLFDSGLRVSELCSLDTSDINLAKREIRVTGKGRVERIVPTTERALKAFSEYILYRSCGDVSAAFVDAKGKRISRRSAYNMIVSCSRQAGLNSVTPHTLRKGCATHLMNSGVDVELIQQLMGHRSLSTTRDYLATDSRRLAQMHERCHPLGR